MNWQEVCEHPSLKDLPFKIELEKKWRKKGNYALFVAAGCKRSASMDVQ